MQNNQPLNITGNARYCLYARKSSEADERQALSIDSQIKEMLELAKRENLNVTGIKRESHSAKDSGTRPVFKELFDDIDKGIYDSIITWAPDRLSRNAGDLGRIVDLMDQRILINIRTHGQNFTNSPNDKFLLMILCSQAKLENDNRGLNIKRGMRAKCEMGLRPCAVPLGYKMLRSEVFGEPSKILIDEERAPFIKKTFQYVNDELSGRQINDYLNSEGFRTKRGKPITLSMTFKILKDTFYYGEFEYPKSSGIWYKGAYEPLITKEEFEQAQEKLKVPDKGIWGRKDFYFSKIFKCGSCGSGITGEEKFNRFGTRYIYYRCNKYRSSKTCKEKYVREEKIIEVLAKLVDDVKNQHQYLEKKLNHEVEKFNQLQTMISGGKESVKISTQNYIEYVLKNGSNGEKSRLLNFLKGKLYLRQGEIVLEE